MIWQVAIVAAMSSLATNAIIAYVKVRRRRRAQERHIEEFGELCYGIKRNKGESMEAYRDRCVARIREFRSPNSAHWN